jgi:HNH endonuclease
MNRRKKKGLDPEAQARFIAETLRERGTREEGYRDRALALFPPVCARCGREFAGKTLRELTVHHKDSNHHNNPPDGSNWELLCLYCHDDEHQDPVQRTRSQTTTPDASKDPPLDHQPFEGLKDLLTPKPDEPDSE